MGQPRNDAGLHLRLEEGRVDRLGEAFQPVDHRDQDVVRSVTSPVTPNQKGLPTQPNHQVPLRPPSCYHPDTRESRPRDTHASMFDFAWSEIALIAAVALIAIGPKDLPVAIRTVAGMVKKARRMAAEFQTHVDEMVREANLDEVTKQFKDIKDFDFKSEVEKHIDPDHTLRDTFAGNPLEPSTPSEPNPAENSEPEVLALPPEPPRAPAFIPPNLIPPPPEPAASAEPPAFIPPQLAGRSRSP